VVRHGAQVEFESGGGPDNGVTGWWWRDGEGGEESGGRSRAGALG